MHFKITGFKAYYIYITMKRVHFTNSKYNFITAKNNNIKNRFVNSWNETRHKKDGHFFHDIELRLKSVQLLSLLYASYWIHNVDFYVRDIIEDNFKKFKENVTVLKRLNEVVEGDLYEIVIYCKDNGISFNDFLFGKHNTSHFKRVQLSSMNTLCILGQIFDLANKLNVNNIIDEEYAKWLKIFFDKYYSVIEKYVNLDEIRLLIKKMIKG